MRTYQAEAIRLEQRDALISATSYFIAIGSAAFFGWLVGAYINFIMGC